MIGIIYSFLCIENLLDVCHLLAGWQSKVIFLRRYRGSPPSFLLRCSRRKFRISNRQPR